MVGWTLASLPSWMPSVRGTTPLQTVAPTAILDLPGLVRGAIAFAIVLALGAAFLWRFDGVVDRSIDASLDRPLSAMGYGIAAHATVVFAGVYVGSQLGQVSPSGVPLTDFGLWAGVVLFAAAAGLGFTVVGAAVVQIGWERRRWHGLLLGALIAGIAALVNPLVGGLIWLVAVSAGIGGAVRNWFHASKDADL